MRRALALALLIAALAGCGLKGDPRPPEPGDAEVEADPASWLP